MAQFILHIGAGKCGSTSIQAGLYEARADLRSKGIIYHPIRRANGHFAYATLMNLRTRGDNDKVRREAERNVSQMRRLLAAKAHEYVILSAESFFNVDPQSIVTTIENLDTSIDSIHVVAYVRSPPDMYLSFIQQQLRASHTIYAPSNFVRDTARVFGRWQATKLCASVTVRLFEPQALNQGSVVKDFEAVLKSITGRTDIALTDVRENTSLSAEQMIVMQGYRRDFFSDIPNRFHPDSSRVLRLFVEMNACFGLVSTKPRLKPLARSWVTQTNLLQIQAFEKMFPAIEMRRYPGDPIQDVSKANIWASGKVEAILDAYQPEIMEALRRLLPRYNSALSSADIGGARASLALLGDFKPFLPSYGKFLIEEGCDAAAQALLV
jgi:hypothetical protein